MRRLLCLCALVAVVPTLSCATGPAGATDSASSAPLRWRPTQRLAQVLDLAGPRADGRLLVAAAGRFYLLGPGRGLRPFARGPHGYSTALGPEPYIALSRGQRVPGAGCAFRLGTAYALEPGSRPGVIRIDASGHAQRVVNLPGLGMANGITFDTVGRFGGRLLITTSKDGRTTVEALDCRSRLSKITGTAPRVEGGIAVAPPTFGRFAGDLIAPDEVTGRILAIDPNGRVQFVVNSSIAHGPDIGVESLGFVPPTFRGAELAYLADRRVPGNPHPGDDRLLALSAAAMKGVGVRPGDLLAVGEGGAATIDVRCKRACRVRHIANGPAISHAEGHMAFATGR